MAQVQYSIEVPVADILMRIVTEAVSGVEPLHRREMLCAVQEHLTAAIANIDEAARLHAMTARMHANRIAWGGWSAVQGYHAIEKEGSD